MAKKKGDVLDKDRIIQASAVTLIFLLAIVVFASALAGSITGASIFQFNFLKRFSAAPQPAPTSPPPTLELFSNGRACTIDGQCRSGICGISSSLRNVCLPSDLPRGQACFDNRQCSSGRCFNTTRGVVGNCDVPPSSLLGVAGADALDSSTLNRISPPGGSLQVEGGLTVSQLSGVGNAYACVNATGGIYRSVTPCR